MDPMLRFLAARLDPASGPERHIQIGLGNDLGSEARRPADECGGGGQEVTAGGQHEVLHTAVN